MTLTWNHETLMAYYGLRKRGYSCRTAARMARRGWR
jgi:hypothetical protein